MINEFNADAALLPVVSDYALQPVRHALLAEGVRTESSLVPTSFVFKHGTLSAFRHLDHASFSTPWNCINHIIDREDKPTGAASPTNSMGGASCPRPGGRGYGVTSRCSW